MSFANKVVLVTGASSGIGEATAILFSKEGANVVIVGRNETKLKSVAGKCEKHGKKVLNLKADITNDEEAKKIIEDTISEFGKLDVLVNNAGHAKFASILSEDAIAAYDYVMNTNLRAHVHMTTLATPHLIKTRGNIINVSSATGTMMPKRPEYIFYYLSKAALNHFSRCTAKELAPHGVRVNAISPGLVETDMLKNAGLNITFKDMNLTAKVLELDEVAENILYLASDKAKSVTGSNFVIDNGFSFTD